MKNNIFEKILNDPETKVRLDGNDFAFSFLKALDSHTKEGGHWADLPWFALTPAAEKRS